MPGIKGLKDHFPLPPNFSTELELNDDVENTNDKEFITTGTKFNRPNFHIVDPEVDGLPGVHKTHVEKAFQDIDFDHNGFIGVGELRYLLTVLGERPTDNELDEMIHMVDTEGHGQVSLEDFHQLFSPDNAVLLQMTSYGPEDSADLEEDSRSSFNADYAEREMRLAIAGVQAIATGAAASKRRRQVTMMAHYTETTEIMPPLPVSNRQRREEMQQLAEQDRLSKGRKDYNYRKPFSAQISRRRKDKETSDSPIQNAPSKRDTVTLDRTLPRNMEFNNNSDTFRRNSMAPGEHVDRLDSVGRGIALGKR